jgi:serine/threonine protein kinase
LDSLKKSPEQRSGLPYDTSVDIWACGMIIFEMITKKRLEYPKYMKEKEIYLGNELNHFKGEFEKYLQLISDCLTMNPDQRPTASDILSQLKGETKEIINEDWIDDNYEFGKRFPSMGELSTEKTLHEQPSFIVQKKVSSSDELSDDSSHVILVQSPDGIVDSSHSLELKRKSFIQEKRGSLKLETIEQPKLQIQIPQISSFVNNSISRKPSLTSEFSLKIIKQNYCHKEVIHWENERVLKWLKEMGMEEYISTFKSNEMDGESLLELEDYKDFQMLKINKVGHIKKLQKYIQLMRETNDS